MASSDRRIFICNDHHWMSNFEVCPTCHNNNKQWIAKELNIVPNPTTSAYQSIPKDLWARTELSRYHTGEALEKAITSTLHHFEVVVKRDIRQYWLIEEMKAEYHEPWKISCYLTWKPFR